MVYSFIFLFGVLVIFEAQILFFICKSGAVSGGTCILFLALTVFTLFAGQYVRKGLTAVTVDPKGKTIAFSNPAFGINRKYQFDKVEGYVSGRIQRGSTSPSSNKVIWLVINGKMRHRIDEMFLRNVNELEAGFKSIPYLGYQLISFRKRLSLIFSTLSPDKG